MKNKDDEDTVCGPQIKIHNFTDFKKLLIPFWTQGIWIILAGILEVLIWIWLFNL